MLNLVEIPEYDNFVEGFNLNATKENPDIKASSDSDYPNFTGTSDYLEIKFSTHHI